MDLLQQRFLTQHIAGQPLQKPEDVVSLLGAVQSQDYIGAKWSLGQRVRNATDRAIDAAFATGRILRIHVMRPTWHFVIPEDIRWIVELTAPHVHALNAYYYRKLEIDAVLFSRCRKLLEKALEGGRQLTRKEIGALLKKNGITAATMRLAYIMMRAELDGVVCSGALRKKEHTYALLAERAPNAKSLQRQEALGVLARRFFTGHAPATLKHFVWWSGLSVKDAKAGLEMTRSQLTSETINGQVFWSGSPGTRATRGTSAAYLIPEYDESLTGSKDLPVADLPRRRNKQTWSDVWYRPVIIAGKRAGTWRRSIAKGTLNIETNLFAALDATQCRALAAAAKRYGEFVELPATLDNAPLALGNGRRAQ